MMPKTAKMICLLLVSPFFFVGGLNYAGMCWSKGKIFSDKEIINRHLEKVFEAQKMRDSFKTNIIFTEYLVKGTEPGKPYISVTGMARRVNPYASVDELLAKRPDACVIGIENIEERPWPSSSGYNPPTLSGKLLGNDSEVIGCELDWKFIDEKGTVTEGYSQSAETLDNCGVVQP